MMASGSNAMSMAVTGFCCALAFPAWPTSAARPMQSAAKTFVYPVILSLPLVELSYCQTRLPISRGTLQRQHGRSLVEREDALPVVLHADDSPAVLLRLVVQRLGEGADLCIGQSHRRAVGILALRIVVQHDHRQPRAVAG